ncbi:MAG: NAD(P)/FAD-dependent oxidoreductase [Lysobacteraceae bacterium]
MQQPDVVIIGAGAAGLMCAITAGRRGRRVRVIEHSNRPGKKILMSGGGRCNFTNTGTTPANFLSANPHFCKSALARFTPWHFIERVEQHGIAYHEKELGQLFCDVSSKLIVKMLLDDAQDAGVEVVTDCSVNELSHNGDRFALRTTKGAVTSESLVIASGGLSIPRMGATGFGYRVAEQFGHRLLPTRAGLVPFTTSGKHLERWSELSGLSLPVQADCSGASFSNAMLFTHRGLSGPAMLQVSSYWQPGDDLRINLLPDTDAQEWITSQRQQRPDAALHNVLADVLPRRFAQRICDLEFGERPMRQYDPPQLKRIADYLSRWPIVVSGTEGYRTAEVTLGGVDTDELSSTTMASKRVPGLHFIGEVVDVTGWLGGYNFQWAWASGHAAGQAC